MPGFGFWQQAKPHKCLGLGGGIGTPGFVLLII
jgi:hypothetical protein